MQTSQTPFQFLQRQDKDRRRKVLNNIERKDLKRRSISYNLKVGQDQQCEGNNKNEVREHYSTIAMNNSIKKSYYYRKMLNKSIDIHMTTEDFQKVKLTFDKITKQDENHQNRAMFFRQLWQKQLVKKEDRYHIHERQNYLQVISTNNHQKQKNIDIQSPKQSKQKEEVSKKNIFDIAQERKASLDFQLEILGKKKSIRIKDNRNKLKINRTLTGEKESKIEQPQKTIQVNTQDDKQQDSPTKACSFFKRFQQQNLLPKHQNDNTDYLQITKLNHNQFPINTAPQISQTSKLKQLRLRYNHSQLQKTDKLQIARQIKSCWKVNRISQRPNKIQTSSDKKRPVLQRIVKQKLPAFNNDIRGWVVGQQKDEQLLQDLN